MIERKVQIVNKLGLHARAAAGFVRTASDFRSKVDIQKDGQEVDGKSILGVLMLAASRGTQLTIRTAGADEQEAMDALTKLVAGRFGERE